MESESRRVLAEKQQLADFVKKLAMFKHSLSGCPIRNDNSVDYGLLKSFDANSYFQVFDKLHMAQGKVLDYIYAYDRHGGMPFLYARGAEEFSIKDAEEFWQKFPKTKVDMILGEDSNLNTIAPYVHSLIFEKSFIGYVQHASFLWVAHKFFLFWHGLYNCRTYFFSKITLEQHIDSMLKEGISFTEQEKDTLQLIDPYPKLLVFKNRVEVYLFNVDPTQKGFYWSKITYQNDIVTRMEVINIIENKVTVFY